MALYYDVRIDISADKVIDSGYHFTQGDSEQIYLRIAVMNGNNKFDASDSDKVTINFKKPDFTFVEGFPELQNDVYVYQFLGNELQMAGVVIADLKFYYSSGRVSSGMFAFTVDKDTSSDEVVQSMPYVNELDKARNLANDILATMQGQSEVAQGILEKSTIYANLSQSYARGGTGTREKEDIDNAKYYKEETERIKNDADQYRKGFKYTHVKYSEYSDGSFMVDAPTEDTIYTGIYTGTEVNAPINNNQYKWVRNRGYDGNAYFATFDVVNGELLMTFNVDPGTLVFKLNEITGELEVTT